MIIDNFLNYESKCPLCNNELTFFIIFDSINPTLWKIKKEKKQYNLILNNIHRLSLIPKKNKGYYFKQNNENYYSFNKDHNEYYLVSICNSSSIKIKENELIIDFLSSCYYRSSQSLDKDFNMKNNTDAINVIKSFSFSDIGLNYKKVYNIQFNYIENKTKIILFLMEKNKKISKFEKEFDFILNMITDDSIKDHKKIIDKINTWITFS